MDVAPPANRMPQRGKGELILMVDDEAAVRGALRHTLERNGYKVLVAADGRAAVALFAQQRENIKLLLTDLMMPEMDGVALIRSLLEMAPDLKVVATSGLPDRERNRMLSVLGVTEILIKPCAPDELLQTVRRMLAPTLT